MPTLSSSVGLASGSAFASTSSIAAAAATRLPLVIDPMSSRISYISSTLTSIIACFIPMLLLIYLAVLSWAWRFSKSNPPMPLPNKASAVLVHRHAPRVYVFLVLSSLTEIATASWLILQYRFNHNYPNIEVRTGTRLLLFTSCWTFLTAGAYSVVFPHPTWSKHPIASIGAQAIWIFVTWLFWIIGAGILNTATSPFLSHKEMCGPNGVAYCAQIRALFGVAVVESLMLAAVMSGMLWLAWQSARNVPEPVSLPMR